METSSFFHNAGQPHILAHYCLYFLLIEHILTCQAHQKTLEAREVRRQNHLHIEVDITYCSLLGCRRIKSERCTIGSLSHQKPIYISNPWWLPAYYISNSICGPGLPCIIEARSRREKAVPSTLPAMSELPEIITINQAEAPLRDSAKTETVYCLLRLTNCETENRMTYLHRKPHREWHKWVIGVVLWWKLLVHKHVCNRCKSAAVPITLYLQ